MEASVSPKKFHYAWFICIGCALLFFLGAGFGTNNMSVYYPFLREQYSFSNTMISVLTTARTVGNVIAMSLVPAYYKRFGMRRGMSVAMCSLVLGFVLLSSAAVYPLFLAAYFVIGLSYGFVCIVPLTMLLDRWFVKDKVTAISVVASASGLATIGFPSLMTAIVKNMGISTCAFMEAVFIAVLAAIAIILIRDCPADMGLTALGAGMVAFESGADDAAGAIHPPRPEGRVKVYSRLFNGRFTRYLPVYLVAVCMGLVGSSAYGNVSLLAVSNGLTVEDAAVAMTIIGVILMVGKLGFGRIGERFGIYRPSVILGILWIAGLILMCFCSLGRTVLFTGCVLYGMGAAMGMVCLVMWPDDWAEGFETDIMRQRMQVTYSATGLIFSVVPGITADLAGGSYIPIFVFYIFTAVLSVYMTIRNYRQARGESISFGGSVL